VESVEYLFVDSKVPQIPYRCQRHFKAFTTTKSLTKGDDRNLKHLFNKLLNQFNDHKRKRVFEVKFCKYSEVKFFTFYTCAIE